jgi:hypothetical protein
MFSNTWSTLWGVFTVVVAIRVCPAQIVFVERPRPQGGIGAQREPPPTWADWRYLSHFRAA